MSARQNSSNNRSTPKTITLPISARKKSSCTRFSCYLKSRNTDNRYKRIKKTLPLSTRTLSKNNNNCHDKIKNISSRKKITKLKNDKICQKCLKLIQVSGTNVSPNIYCSSCYDSIQNSKNMLLRKKFSLNKNEEKELRHMIEIIIEEFQDHFGLALSLSMKQMTQHLLSNISLFYNHYQQEFEKLTKKYRQEFLERFIQLINKYQNDPKRTNIIQKTKSSVPDQVN